ncbi:MAG TPA: transporter substrate-binding domain-containing protein [Thiohalobacter sp.]|nr:transporter substrate-binding domain-containing protein [Thiohalobacter sp.]
MYFRAILFLPLVMLLMSPGCGQAPDSDIPYRDLETIRASGKLIVLTRNAPTTWYIGRDDAPTGPEYDMVEAFAAHLGVEAEYRIEAGVPEILQALEAGEGDLAAAGLTRLDSRRERFAYGPAYQDVTQQVVCRRDNVQPETVEELAGLELEVIGDSSYSRRLQELKAEHPQLEWRETTEHTTEELLRAVWERELDCMTNC